MLWWEENACILILLARLALASGTVTLPPPQAYCSASWIGIPTVHVSQTTYSKEHCRKKKKVLNLASLQCLSYARSGFYPLFLSHFHKHRAYKKQVAPPPQGIWQGIRDTYILNSSVHASSLISCLQGFR